MAHGCIGSIGCYANECENGSAAIPIEAKITPLVAHIYFSIGSITIITLHA